MFPKEGKGWSNWAVNDEKRVCNECLVAVKTVRRLHAERTVAAATDARRSSRKDSTKRTTSSAQERREEESVLAEERVGLLTMHAVVQGRVTFSAAAFVTERRLTCTVLSAFQVMS